MMFEASVVTSIPSLWSAMNSWFTPAVLFLLLNIMIGTIALTSTLTPSHGQNQEEHTRHHQHQQEDGQQEEIHHVPVPLLQPLPKSPSIIERVKSLKLFSPKSQQPLIPPSDEVPGEMNAQKDPVQKQEQEPPRSHSSLGKIKPFDLYSYLPQEPTSEISRETDTHYIFEQTRQESSFSHEREEKGEEKKAEEETGEEEEEKEAEEGYEGHTEVPANLVRRSIRRSESLNVRFTFSNLKEDATCGFDQVDVEAVEKRRPATVREGKAKWGAGDEEVDARADDFINRFKEQLKLQRMDSLGRQKDLMISKVSAARSI